MTSSVSAYFRICTAMLGGKILQLGLFTSLLRGMEHASSLNFLLCRELVMTVNMPVVGNAGCRIIAGVGSSTH